MWWNLRLDDIQISSSVSSDKRMLIITKVLSIFSVRQQKGAWEYHRHDTIMSDI